MWNAGLARDDVTVLDRSMALLGWGVPSMRPERVGAPLHARALVLREGAEGPLFALVVVDLCFVPGAIRDAVDARLRDRHGALGLHGRTMITATHTHAGPNGISDHLYFALSGPGVSQATREVVVSGIVGALVRAHAELAPALVSYSTDEVPLCDAAAFNRSWRAWSANPEVDPVSCERRDEAVDRTVRVLAIRRPESATLCGVVSWFPLHGTSVHSDVRVVHPDHKGVAATDLERQLQGQHPGVIAMFAQEAAGDVTPNYRYDAARGLVVGRHDDDLDSAQHAADAQRRAVMRALSKPARALQPRICVATETLDLSRAPIDPALVSGREGVRTRPPALGFAMTEGTAEGPGPLARFAPIRRKVVDVLRAARCCPELPFVELGRGRAGRVFGLGRVDGPVLRALLRDVGPFFVHALDEHAGPFVPLRVPITLVLLGDLALAGLPCEPTTIAGRRVRRSVEAALVSCGEPVTDVVVAAYADEYVGYVTTPEEYALQHYEAACTFFGPHTLDAYRTAHARMARRLAPAEAS